MNCLCLGCRFKELGYLDPNNPENFPGLNGYNGSFRPDTPSRPTRVVFIDQSPFEIVFILLIIAGIPAGLIGLSFDYGSLAAVRMKRGLELLFFELVYAGLAVALLYAFISYTSRLIYQGVSSGYAEVGFLLLTAYIISSSLLLSFGHLRSKVPVGLCRYFLFQCAGGGCHSSLERRSSRLPRRRCD